ncbi:MAG: glycosyltransferase [Candidatus Hydrothermarchaeaceae archaeon]
MELPSVSIIIPNYNGREHLDDCLSSISELNYPEDRREVLLVDNASTDGSCEFVELDFPGVKIIRNAENLGFSGGINAGAKSASGDYLVFLNSDMRVDRDWLIELIKPIADNPVKCSGSKVLNWDGSKIDFAGRRSDIFYLRFKPMEGEDEYESGGNMLFASGGAMAIRKDLYFEAGGFDDDYYMYHEDVDLGWRLWLMGYEIVLARNSIVYHRGGAASGKLDPGEVQLYHQRNALLTLIKNFDEDNFWRILPPFLDFLVQRSKYTLKAGEAFVPALYDAFFKNLDATLDKREEIQSKRKRSDSEIFSKVDLPYESILEMSDHRGADFKDRRRLKEHFTKVVFDAYRKEVESQQKHIDELNSVLQSHEAAFQILGQSLVWQLLRGFDLIIEKVLPLDTRRRRYYEKCTNAVRAFFIAFRNRIFKNLVESESAREYREKINAVPAKSADKVDILCLPNTGWGFRFMRHQHLLSLFARDGHRVFYVDVGLEPGPERFSVRKLGENIFELRVDVPSIFNIYRDDWTAEQGHLKHFIESLNLAKERFGIDALTLLVYPSWVPIAFELRRLHGWKIVYDCIDDYGSFKGISPQRIEEEKELFRESDMLVVTSSYLAKKAGEYREDFALIRNAVVFEHFKTLPYNELLKMPKPIIGFYGEIEQWVDTGLLEYLVEKRSDWNFVFIGRTLGADIESIKKFPNAHFLGEKLYSELPKYLFHFDVCIIPFNSTPFVEASNPIKFYEYISSGKPVVSTDIPELRKHRDLCYIAEGKEDFLDKIEIAIAEDDSELKKKRIELAKNNTWESRYRMFSARIKQMPQE